MVMGLIYVLWSIYIYICMTNMVVNYDHGFRLERIYIYILERSMLLNHGYNHGTVKRITQHLTKSGSPAGDPPRIRSTGSKRRSPAENW